MSAQRLTRKQLESMVNNPVTSSEACFHMIISLLEEVIELMKKEPISEIVQRKEVSQIEEKDKLEEQLSELKLSEQKPKRKRKAKGAVSDELQAN